MTADEYARRSNSIENEMRRLRTILDRRAYAKSLGVNTEEALNVPRDLKALDDAHRNFRALNEEFWAL